MTRKTIHPAVKIALELGPIILFFLVFGRIKDQTFHVLGRDYSGFIVTTFGFVLLICATTAILWRLTGHLSRMQVMTLVLVVLMGGLSVALNNEAFIKMKPTLLYAFFGGALGFGLLRGQSYLRLVMEEGLPMKPEGWMILTRRLCLFFLALAVANEVVWRGFSTEAWVDFKTFVLPGALFAFFLAQARLMSTHALEEPQEAGSGAEGGPKG